MKISDISVDGYGVWCGLKLEALADGVNVFYGPNEAGKTTLLEFVRSVLYGFSRRRRDYLPPIHGGRPGGSLRIASHGGMFLLSRYDDRAEDPGGVGRLTIEAADGTSSGEHLLPTLISHVDEAIFNNVFAIGLRELQELAVLSDTEAGSLLYNLSAGLDRVSLVEVMRELGASRKRIISADGQQGQLPDLLAERRRLREEVEELGRMTRQFGRLTTDREQVEREAGRLEQEHDELRHEARVVEIALAVRRRWQQRAELDEQLAALAPAATMPEDAVARLDAVQQELASHRETAEQLQRERRRLGQEAAELKVSRSFWRQAPRIEALCEQESWIGTLEEQIFALEAEVEELESKMSAERERLGIDISEAAAPLPTLSTHSLARLRRPAAALRQCRRRAEEAKQEASAAEDSALALGEELEQALAARGFHNLGEALDQTGSHMAQLRRRVQLDQRLDQMSRYRSDLEEQHHELIGRQLLPPWIIVGLGSVFVLGVVLLMASWFLPESAIGPVALPMTLLGIAGIAAGIVTKVLLDRSNFRQLEATQKQISLLNLQIKQAKEEREGLDHQLSRHGGPVVNRLESAERELAALEELTPLDARHQTALREAEATAARVAQAEQDLAAARRRWRDALEALGLPTSLAPRQVRRLLDGSDRLNEIAGSLQRRREELQQRHRELESISRRISQLATETGVDVAGCDVAEQLRRLGAGLRRQEAAFQRRNELKDLARKLRRKQSRHEAAASQCEQRVRELFREAGVKTEKEFRRQAMQHARAKLLTEQHTALQREIEAAIGGHCPEEMIGRRLDEFPGERLENSHRELNARLEELRKQLQERFERRGRLNEQIKALSDDRRLPAKQLELAVVEQRLKDFARRWRVLALTSRTLESVRGAYERDRQPETLRQASGYLERFTDGRYCRVWTPLDEDVLRVDDASGRPIAVECLSRGTREQLFLCLRLALAATYARRGIQLPLVLDDVLVNFDSHRAKAAAAVLRDFAADGHQMLVFTCHEHIRKLFKSLKVAVNDLPDCTESDLPPIVIQGSATRKPKRQIAAEVEPGFAPADNLVVPSTRVEVLPARPSPSEEELEDQEDEELEMLVAPVDDELDNGDEEQYEEEAYEEDEEYDEECDEYAEDEAEEDEEEPEDDDGEYLEEEIEEEDFQWEEASDDDEEDYEEEDYDAGDPDDAEAA